MMIIMQMLNESNFMYGGDIHDNQYADVELDASTKHS